MNGRGNVARWGGFSSQKNTISPRGGYAPVGREWRKSFDGRQAKKAKIGGGEDADSKNGTGKIRIFLAAFKSRPDTKLHRKGWKERKREKWWSVVGGLRSLAWIGGRQVPTSRCVAQYESSSLRFSFISSFFLVPACDHGVRAGSKPEFVSSPCQEAIQTNVSIR